MSKTVTAAKSLRVKLILGFAATLVVVGGGTAAGVALTSGGADVTALPAPTRSATHLNPPTTTTTGTPSTPAGSCTGAAFDCSVDAVGAHDRSRDGGHNIQFDQ